MKIHGTAKGGALSTKDFGVAFGGAVPSQDWTTGAIINENRGLAPSGSLVGTKVTDVSDLTISSITMNFPTSASITIGCYIQESDGTITQFGSNYVNSSAGDHTFTGSQYIALTDFIIYVYATDTGANTAKISVQIDDPNVTIGVEMGYFPKTLTPTYSSWTTPSCPTNYCAVYMSFVYT
jgi:hypothetical protein